MIATKKLLSVLFTGAIVASATATDYYVAKTGSDSADGSATTPFATVDKAIITATSSDDVIHVEPGTYSTTTPAQAQAAMLSSSSRMVHTVRSAWRQVRGLRMSPSSAIRI